MKTRFRAERRIDAPAAVIYQRLEKHAKAHPPILS